MARQLCAYSRDVIVVVPILMRARIPDSNEAMILYSVARAAMLSDRTVNIVF